MNLRKIIKGLIPYGIVRLHQKRKEKNSQVVSFWEGYLNYKKNHSHCELLNVSPVKTVVSVLRLHGCVDPGSRSLGFFYFILNFFHVVK